MVLCFIKALKITTKIIVVKTNNIKYLILLKFGATWLQNGPSNTPIVTHVVAQIEAVIIAMGKNTFGLTWSKPAMTEVYPRINGVRRPIYIPVNPFLAMRFLSLKIDLTGIGSHLGLWFNRYTPKK